MDTRTTTITSADVAQTLSGDGLPGPAPWRAWIRWVVLALLLVVVGFVLFGRGGGKATQYVTQEVARGNLIVTVTATGNLEPRNQVDIGSELSGTMRDVNVAVNDVVTEGEVLAVLDTSRLNAQALQAQSSLASAEARVLQGEAGLKKAHADHARMQKVRELSDGKLPSQQEMDVAEAAVAQAQGELAAAQAAVEQARANLDVVRTDLGKSAIRSPINGVVLVRSVEPGQTVAASLQAPILFTLAEDLRKMELHVAVDEADVGAVEVGQKATFTVAAFPDRTFSANITQVHFASSNTQSSSGSGGSASSATATGVVTYETVLEVDNSDLLLRPGMTATAEIVTINAEDAVLVPNAALRFSPASGQPASASAPPRSSALSALMPQMRRRPGNSSGGPQARPRSGSVWILENGQPVQVAFRPGASDGRMTQVLTLGSGPSPGADARAEGAQRESRNGGPSAIPPRQLEAGMKVIVDVESTAP